MMNKKMKIASLLLVGVMTLTALVGCGNKDDQKDPQQQGNAFDTTKTINVVSREDGSGTRDAFIELMGIEEKDDNGNKVDHTTPEATTVSSTDVVMTTVAGDTYAIGYISLGSLNETVKAVSVDGVEATSANVKDGIYAVARPFNIATKGEVSVVAQDFINYIMSKEGQEVVAGSYIPVLDDAPAFSTEKPQGKIVVAGSSSVTPVMEKLQEAYMALNPNATIEIQQSDSTTGMTSAIDGVCDIGMASRELKDSEKEQLTSTTIAVDGIAVVVNPENPVTNLTSAQIKDIYTGATTTWDIVEAK